MNENVLSARQCIIWSQEMLTHFKCTQCQAWWSIADFDRLWAEHFNRPFLHCPICGIRQRLPDHIRGMA